MNILIIIFIITLLQACKPKNDVINLHGETMGTTYSIKIVDIRAGELEPGILKSEIDELLYKINMQMSTYIPESEISKFNRSAANVWFEVSSSFLEVLNLSIQVNSESDGAFDPTIMPAVNLWGFGRKGRRNAPPSNKEIIEVRNYIGMEKILQLENTISKTNPHTELDFSAIAKGYAVDAVARLVAEKGYKSYMVEIGGEVVTKGLKNDATPWRIGIDKPDIEMHVEKAFQAILVISDVAVATSGDYRNFFIMNDSLYSHTIDPVTCHPIINGMASVTVIAPSCILADAMATAIMVMGSERGLEWVESKSEVETMIIERNKDSYSIVTSSGFGKYLEN